MDMRPPTHQTQDPLPDSVLSDFDANLSTKLYKMLMFNAFSQYLFLDHFFWVIEVTSLASWFKLDRQVNTTQSLTSPQTMVGRWGENWKAKNEKTHGLG